MGAVLPKNLTCFGIQKQMIHNALKCSKTVLQTIAKYADISEKVKSEIVSGVVEKELAKSLSKKLGFPVQSPKSDNDPDLLFTSFPNGKNSVEIKVAYMEKGSGSWRGGSFSKRDAPHILIARNSDLSLVYVSFLHMKPTDWKKSGSANYYAHTISKKELILRSDNFEFFGHIERRKKKGGTMTKKQIDMKMDRI
jgi:hypothetical protein